MYAEGKKEWPILIIITITGGTKYTYVGRLCRNVNMYFLHWNVDEKSWFAEGFLMSEISDIAACKSIFQVTISVSKTYF